MGYLCADMTPGLKKGNKERSFLGSAVLIRKYIQCRLIATCLPIIMEAKRKCKQITFSLFWTGSPKLCYDMKIWACAYREHMARLHPGPTPSLHICHCSVFFCFFFDRKHLNHCLGRFIHTRSDHYAIA
jgi:hypothetical protein